MSGLMTSESLAMAGPREEKPAICGTRSGRAARGVAELEWPRWRPAVAAYGVIAGRRDVGSTCTVGTEWKSASRLPGVVLTSTMPTPPARSTSALLATRS